MKLQNLVTIKKNPIKDCSWQPFKLMIVSSSFDGKIGRWEYPLDDKAESLSMMK